MSKLALILVLVFTVGSCASLPDDCSGGQTVAWDDVTSGWSCADLQRGVPRHTHQVTEIKTSCEDGQVVAWDGESSGWVCAEAAGHEHEGEQLSVYPPTYYSVDVRADREENLESVFIEGHRFCALSETQASPGGRCEVVLTTEGFSLQAWASPGARTECGAVCF